MSTYQNRPYQDAALSAITNEFQKGTSRQLLSMATGTGKTVVFAQLPDRAKHILPGQMLVLAHREELIDQAIDKMRAINPTLRIDKEKAEHKADPSQADCIVASVATLGRKGTKRLDKYNWERIDKYVTDEAHHSIATTYRNIYEAANLLHGDNRRLLLGVTATPQRGDGKALAEIYQKISFVYAMRQAIEDGWLVDVRGVRVSTGTSLDAVKTVGGDFAQDMLADAVNNPRRNQLVVKAWKDHADNRQTIAFSVDIQHAVDLAAMFKEYGVNAEAVWGDDPQRAEKLVRHKARQITVLVNCGVLVEGYDDWQIGCIVLARPTKSSVLFTQMVGRGTRLQDGTGNLKELIVKYRYARKANGRADDDLCCFNTKQDCIVIDVVDASTKHSLITLPTLMGMSRALDLKGGSLVKAIQRIEEAQRQHTNIDFSALDDITNLEAYVESVNLFDVKFPAEVEENSELTWHPAASGGFLIRYKENVNVKIAENLLDKWDISGTINGQKYRGERDTIEQAFQAADSLIREKAAESLKILNREATWHGDPATPAQLNLLRKLLRGQPLPADMDKGKASRLIGSFLAAKA